MARKRILIIAGSDSSGGAGLEADQKVMAVHGCYAMTATTALTAQNTTKVFDIHVTPSDFVRKQIDACVVDIGVDVVKTGMLASAETVKVVAESLEQHAISTSVVDPVMVSTSGSQLLPKDAVEILCRRLLPLTTLLTPNIPEASLILQTADVSLSEPKCVNDIVEMAKRLHDLGPKYVLLKGGHLPLTKDHLVPHEEAEKHIVLNVLVGNGETMLIESDYISSRNTHGTGCSLASAIASNLANGMAMGAAVKAANSYVQAGIRLSQDLGKGNGPINHFHSTYTLPFSPGGFVEYMLSRADIQETWTAHMEHEFVKKLADGTLPLENFKHFLVQDYLFLLHFSRANALAAYKAKNFDEIARSATIVSHFKEEVQLHLEYCKGFGLSLQDIEQSPESIACTAYTRHILDVGQSEDWFTLQVSLLPCSVGYKALARRWYDDESMVRDGNKYLAWFEQYVGEHYVNAVKASTDLIEKHAIHVSPHRLEELAQIFIQSTRMEIGFWDMGLNLSK